MFNETDIQALDRKYFNVIVANDRDVTIQSKNTGHYWYLHCTDYPKEGKLVCFHKHRYKYPYHQHSREKSLRQAVKNIQGHDQWQMKGRKIKN